MPDQLFWDLALLQAAARALRQPTVKRKHVQKSGRVEVAARLFAVMLEAADQFGWLDAAESMMLKQGLDEVRKIIQN